MKYFITLLLIFTACTLFAEMPVVEKWGQFEITLTGPQTGNPFKDVEVGAVFSNGQKTLFVAGFYDGKGIYKIRFMPCKEGTWQYKTRSNKNALNGREGEFVCIRPGYDNHGPVRVRNTFHLGYADGTPYWQVGTTCYAWVHQTEALQLQTLETLKNAPFNKLRMCVFPKDYVYNENEPPYYPFPRNEAGENDYTRFNPEFFRHFESRLQDLLNLGIEADIILFHPYDRWGYQSMHREVDVFYLKYVLARFASYRHVWWSLANEFDFMEHKTPHDWDHIYQVIKENDPYDHLAGIHNGYVLYDHTRPWVSHASIQSSDLDRGATWRDAYQKPVIYDECRYEGNIKEGWGNQSAEEMVHKFWLGTIRGCYVGHGETYQHPEDILWWSKGGVLHGESPARIAFYKKVLESGHQDGIDPIDEYSGGRTGEYYLYYFGTDSLDSYQLDLPDKVNFEIELLDVWNMTITPAEGIFSGVCHIDLPGKPYQALRIRKAGYNFPLEPVKTKPAHGLFYQSAEIKLWTHDNLKIHYTLDGTTPTLASPVYKKPVKINTNILVRAIAVDENLKKSEEMSRQFIRATIVPSLKNLTVSPGILYHYYEGQWEYLPDFDTLSSAGSGVLKQFGIPDVRQRDHFGLVFRGYVHIEKEGVYTFFCSSDDGSHLWVADSLIVENDGCHAEREAGGQIGLARGLHKINVHFFENEGGEVLKVMYEGPDVEKQEIPESVLKH